MNKERERTIKSLSLVLAGGVVKRYHTKVTIGQQTNADHQWGVAVLLDHIYPDASKDLIIAALLHDSYETITGDVPSPSKWMYQELNKVLIGIERNIAKNFNFMPVLTAEEKQILKAADCLEMMIFSHYQVALGNKGYADVYKRCLKHLKCLESVPRSVVGRILELEKEFDI